MSADEPNKISLTGRVEKRNLGGASKSAHAGFVLQTRDRAIKLRRDRANPFYDDFFEKYENDLCHCIFISHHQYLFAADQICQGH